MTDRSPAPGLPAENAVPAMTPLTVEAAADRLAAGGLVAFPTETVYGLGARADDDRAVAGIFAAKGRPSDHPLIVHVAGAADVPRFAAHVPPEAEALMARFWPGPLTLILPRREGVAGAAAGGQASIGLRCPAHPLAQALLAAAAARGVAGVAAPSANRFGRVSPTTAAHVVQEFDGTVPVLDGGACPVGIESAIVDLSRGRPVLLRPGTLDRERLQAVLGQPVHDRDAQAPRASGTLAAHYAPSARVRLLDTEALRAALSPAAAAGRPEGLAVYSRSALPLPAGVVHRPMPEDPLAAAQELFAALRALDALGARHLWIETPPSGPAWEGVMDRLARAAAAG
jgi:L-threonylcarbamoyladenylate synthase